MALRWLTSVLWPNWTVQNAGWWKPQLDDKARPNGPKPSMDDREVLHAAAAGSVDVPLDLLEPSDATPVDERRLEPLGSRDIAGSWVNNPWSEKLDELLSGRTSTQRYWHSCFFVHDKRQLHELLEARRALPDFQLLPRPQDAFGKQAVVNEVVTNFLALDGRYPAWPESERDRPDAQHGGQRHALDILAQLAKRAYFPEEDYPPPEVVAWFAATAVENFDDFFALLRQRFTERLALDVAELRDLKKAHPRLSLEEIRRVRRHVPWTERFEPGCASVHRLCDDDSHFTPAYVETCCRPLLEATGPLDCMGPEPNLLLAIHLTDAMVRAPVGTTYSRLIESYRRENPQLDDWWPGFSVADLEALQCAYEFIPRWPVNATIRQPKKTAESPSLKSIPTAHAETLRELRILRYHSPLLGQHADLRHEGRVLENHEIVTMELATSNVVGYLAHLVKSLGADGRRTAVIWKPYADDAQSPADVLIPSICERMFGIRSLTPKTVQEMNTVVADEMEAAFARAGAENSRVAAHLIGLQDMSRVGPLLRENADRENKVILHTASDIDTFQRMGLTDLSALNMASAPAKHLFEDDMLADAFEASFIELGRSLDADLTARNYLVHGAGNVGAAVLRALLRRGIPPHQIAVSDPKYTGPVFRFAANPFAEDEDHENVRLAPSSQVALEFRRPLVSINATPDDVLTREMLENLQGAAPLIHVNLGSNQKDHHLVRDLSFDSQLQGPDRQEIGRIGRQGVFKYSIGVDPSDESPKERRMVDIILPGDGKVLNHAFERIIPTEQSDFINLLKTESWYQADWNLSHARKGMQVLHSVHVGEVSGPRGRSVIAVLLPRDTTTWQPEPDTLRGLAESSPRESSVTLVRLQECDQPAK